MRPIATCAMVVVERTRVGRSHRNHPAFPTQWFTDYGALSPVLRACWPPSPALLLADLTPASGCQDHTLSPSASNAFVKSTISVHRIPPRVRDDHDTPLLVGRDREQYRIIRIFGKAEYFCRKDLTAGGGQSRANKGDLPDRPAGDVQPALSFLMDERRRLRRLLKSPARLSVSRSRPAHSRAIPGFRRCVRRGPASRCGSRGQSR